MTETQEILIEEEEEEEKKKKKKKIFGMLPLSRYTVTYGPLSRQLPFVP